jgi:hypothetical protein
MAKYTKADLEFPFGANVRRKRAKKTGKAKKTARKGRPRSGASFGS